MFKYKIKVIGIAMVDWQSLQTGLFGNAQTVWAQFGGQEGEFHFNEEPQVSDLGKLIQIETIQ